jgi:leader peptidase (prepilin peptidase)/N-methyltransferase
VPLKKSVNKPARSFCPKCETTLSALDNIPVFSWLILGAKCRYCKERISGEYPLVEALTAFAAIASYIQFGGTLTALIIFLFTATLIVISFIDFHHKIIPNVISFPGMAFGLCLGIFSQFSNTLHPPLTQSAFDSLLGFLIGGGLFYSIAYGYYFVTKRHGMGMGDVKLMGFIGAMLGWESIYPTVIVGSCAGGVFGIMIMLLAGGNGKSEIPYGPWLSLGAIIYMFLDIPFFRLVAL